MEDFSLKNNAKEPVLSHTVLTEVQGDRLYVSAVTFYEKIHQPVKETSPIVEELLKLRENILKEKENHNHTNAKEQRSCFFKKVEVDHLESVLSPSEVLSPDSLFHWHEENKKIRNEFGLRIVSFQIQFSCSLFPHTEANKRTVSGFAPKSICIISSFPLFSLFSKILTQMYLITHNKQKTEFPVSHLIKFLTRDLLVPNDYKLTVDFQLGNETFSYFRPPVIQQKVVDDYYTHLDVSDFSFLLSSICYSTLQFSQFPLSHLFGCFSIDSILLMLTGLLRERKILMKSRHTILLTVVSQSLLSLLYPFTWPHVYIPCLPAEL